MKVLFDTNVILDALTNRYDNSHYSERLIQYALIGKLQPYILSSQMTDIYYCLRKYINNEDEKRKFINLLATSFEILHPMQSNIVSATKNAISDYEDALIDEVARINCVDYIVTNNIKDFENSNRGIITPRELCSLLDIEY